MKEEKNYMNMETISFVLFYEEFEFVVISTTKDQGKCFYLAAAIKQHFNVFDCSLDILISYCSLFDFYNRSFFRTFYCSVQVKKKENAFNL